MKKYVIIRTQVEAIHSWPECPYEDVSFLRSPHRHIFHIEIKISVGHNDREVEFIRAKRKIEEQLRGYGKLKDIGSTSCEDMAEEIYSWFGTTYPIISISVFEDNENGAEIIFEEKE